jgi:hypothetical protein
VDRTALFQELAAEEVEEGVADEEATNEVAEGEVLNVMVEEDPLVSTHGLRMRMIDVYIEKMGATRAPDTERRITTIGMHHMTSHIEIATERTGTSVIDTLTVVIGTGTTTEKDTVNIIGGMMITATRMTSLENADGTEKARRTNIAIEIGIAMTGVDLQRSAIIRNASARNTVGVIEIEARTVDEIETMADTKRRE